MKIGAMELIVIFIVALLVIGPDKLPMYAQKFGNALREFRKASSGLTQDIRESVVEPLEEAQRPLREAMEPLEDLNKDVLSFLLRAFVPLRDENEARPAQAPRRKTDMSQMRTQRNDLSTNGEQKSNTPIKADKKIGRNEPCPCGSGKKYKNCHGAGLV